MISINSISALKNQPWEVTLQGDIFDWDNMNFKEFEELFKSGAKEITLKEDVVFEAGEKETYENGIEINEKGLIINGNGHAIDGKAQVSLLYIKAEVTLKNILFKNAYCEYSGGAIFNDSDLKIENCGFCNNSSDEFGGAVYNKCYSRLTIINSGFRKNRADYGGAIFNDSNSLANLDGAVFKSNSSEFEGGAIYNKSKLSVYGTLFYGNASFKGGSIYNEGMLNIRDCNFEKNIASEGNDIKNQNENNLNIHNCSFH